MKTRMHEATRRWSGLCVVLLIAFGGSGCAAVKGAITPFAVVRDVVDAPLVSATNGFQYFADRTKIENAPRAGVGWSWPAGFGLGIGYDISHFLWVGCSYLFGGVDYAVCRSLYPNWAAGISPWIRPGGGWGDLYFPNTRALWSDERGEDAGSQAPTGSGRNVLR